MIRSFTSFGLFILISVNSYASKCNGFLPANHLSVFPNDKSNNGINFTKFKKIIDNVFDKYKKQISEKKVNLEINYLWDDETVNAHTYSTKNNEWVFDFYGGLARHSLISGDSYTLAVCHELGHHLGGAPLRQSKNEREGTSVEGEADYFASLKCLRKVWQNDDNQRIVEKLNIGDDIKERCSLVYNNDRDFSLCIRIGAATKSLLQLLKVEKNEQVSLPLAEVSNTITDHPVAECRSETLIQGALCDVSVNIDLDNRNPSIGSCTKLDGHNVGLRPRCWYQPKL